MITRVRRGSRIILNWLLVAVIVSILAAIFFPVETIDRFSGRRANLSCVKQLVLAVIMFENDHDDTLPRDKRPGSLEQDLHPYLKSDNLWFTGDPPGSRFFFNWMVAGKDSSRFAHPEDVVLIYQPEPDEKGMRAVAFADGHAKAFDQDAWQLIYKSMRNDPALKKH